MMQKITDVKLYLLLKRLGLEKDIYRVNLEFEEFGPGKHDYGSVKFDSKKVSGRFRKIGVSAKYDVKKAEDGVIYSIEIRKMFQFTGDPKIWAFVTWQTKGKDNFV